MAKLTLMYDDRVLGEYSLGSRQVTIGRLPDNTIVVDNAAVSGRHARVFTEGQHWVIEDLASTNGTFINQKPVTTRQPLLDKDVVLVGKHTLVFSQAMSEQPEAAAAEDPFVPEIGGTMMLDTQKQKELLANVDRSVKSTGAPKAAATAAPRIGFVRIVSGKTEQPEYPLSSATSIIGKADNAQIRVKGWFKPKVAAAIARKGDAYSVTPMSGKTKVNGAVIAGRRDLTEGDMIEVAGLTLEFQYRG